MSEWLSQLEQWYEENAYQKIIDCLESRSKTQALDYGLT